MKLIFENWRKFLNEADTESVPWRQTVREKPAGFHGHRARLLREGLKPMDPADIKTPAPMGSPPEAEKKEILKTKSLIDIRDIRAANIGVSQQDESLPIIFDY